MHKTPDSPAIRSHSGILPATNNIRSSQPAKMKIKKQVEFNDKWKILYESLKQFSLSE